MGNNLFKRLYLCIWRNIYKLLYLVFLTFLWSYLYFNWEECISMQFFSDFDGNNILFLVTILLTALPFYNIEGNGIKIQNNITRRMENEIQNAETQYELEQQGNHRIVQMNNLNNQQEVSEID